MIDYTKDKSKIILKGFQTPDIKKSRSGTYSDNADNRSKKRVGQEYGSKKEEEPTKEKPTKKKEEESTSKKKTEDTSKKEKLKNEDSKGVEGKTTEDHAKDTSDEELQDFVDNADETTDPELLKQAESELKSRSKEGKSSSEKEIMQIDEDITYYEKEVAQIESNLSETNVEMFQRIYREGIEEGNKEIDNLRAKKEKLVEKAKKDKQPKVEKEPDKFAKAGSISDLTKRISEIGNEVNTLVSDGKFNKVQPLLDEQRQYTDEIAVRLGFIQAQEEASVSGNFEVGENSDYGKITDRVEKGDELQVTFEDGKKFLFEKDEDNWLEKEEVKPTKFETGVNFAKEVNANHQEIKNWGGEDFTDDQINSVFEALVEYDDLSQADLYPERPSKGWSSPEEQSDSIREKVGDLSGSIQEGYWEKDLDRDDVNAILEGIIRDQMNK